MGLLVDVRVHAPVSGTVNARANGSVNAPPTANVMALELGGLRVEARGVAGLVTLGACALVGAAVADQLRLPSAERTWHGHLWGFVPYDFRVPTLERVRESLWDPASERLLTDRAYGVGWGVNFATLSRWARACCGVDSAPVS